MWIPSPFPLSLESSYPEPEKGLDIWWMTQTTGLWGHFREQNSEEGAFSKHGSTDVRGRAEMGCLLQEQYRHTGGLEPGWSNVWFKSSQDVIFPRGHQLIPKEERILGRESDPPQVFPWEARSSLGRPHQCNSLVISITIPPSPRQRSGTSYSLYLLDIKGCHLQWTSRV